MPSAVQYLQKEFQEESNASHDGDAVRKAGMCESCRDQPAKEKSIGWLQNQVETVREDVSKGEYSNNRILLYILGRINRKRISSDTYPAKNIHHDYS